MLLMHMGLRISTNGSCRLTGILMLAALVTLADETMLFALSSPGMGPILPRHR